jgi:hypothetical protein
MPRNRQKRKRKEKELKSRLPVRVVLKGQDYEVSTQGTITTISKELNALRQLAHWISAGKGAELVLPTVEKVTQEFPSIRTTRSTGGNIESLFETNWGRTPRNVAEVVRALESNAVPDSVTNVSVYANRLVKKGVLRRVKRAGKWSYYRLPSE